MEDLTLKKVIVIGPDRLEPTILQTLLATGELPNLVRLCGGGFLQGRHDNPRAGELAHAPVPSESRGSWPDNSRRIRGLRRGGAMEGRSLI